MTNKYPLLIATVDGWKDIEERNENPSRREILEEAKKMGLQWEQIEGTKTFRLWSESHSEFFTGEVSGATSYIGYISCLDKYRTKCFLQKNNVSTPKGFLISKNTSHDEIVKIFDELHKPLVVKPAFGKKGEKVFMHISDKETFMSSLLSAFEYQKNGNVGVLVEEQFSGKEYRILVSREKVVGVLNRVPANVVGDGIHTIEELIDKKNEDTRRQDNPKWYLVKIKKDETVLLFLEKQGLSLTSVVPEGKQIFLRGNSNISTGGDSIDMTDTIHPSVGEIALRAINSIPGLAFAGVDFMTENIHQQQNADTYKIIEINHSPALEMHHFPFQGTPRNAAREFILTMFPELS